MYVEKEVQKSCDKLVMCLKLGIIKILHNYKNEFAKKIQFKVHARNLMQGLSKSDIAPYDLIWAYKIL